MQEAPQPAATDPQGNPRRGRDDLHARGHRLAPQASRRIAAPRGAGRCCPDPPGSLRSRWLFRGQGHQRLRRGPADVDGGRRADRRRRDPGRQRKCQSAERFRERLGIKPGDVYNSRVIGRATGRLTREIAGSDRDRQAARRSAGGRAPWRFRARQGHPRAPRHEERADRTAALAGGSLQRVARQQAPRRSLAGRRPVAGDGRRGDDLRTTRISTTPTSAATCRTSSGRNTPATRSARSAPSSARRSCSSARKPTTSRRSARSRLASKIEQTIVSLGFKTPRDYYRRRGEQIFTVLRIGANNELSAMARWDRHEPLENTTT